MNTIDLTEKSLILFLKLADLAKNFMNPEAPVNISYEQQNDLTDLKENKLITTYVLYNSIWCKFTELGSDFALKYGIDVNKY